MWFPGERRGQGFEDQSAIVPESDWPVGSVGTNRTACFSGPPISSASLDMVQPHPLRSGRQASDPPQAGHRRRQSSRQLRVLRGEKWARNWRLESVSRRRTIVGGAASSVIAKGAIAPDVGDEPEPDCSTPSSPTSTTFAMNGIRTRVAARDLVRSQPRPKTAACIVPQD